LDVYNFNKNGYAAVSSSQNNFGIINKKGAYQVNPKYKAVLSYGSNFLGLQTDGKMGILDEKGKDIIPFDFNKIIPSFFDYPYAIASMDGQKWGIIDGKGTFTVNPQFDNATPFLYGMAIVEFNKQIGIVDEKGKYILNPSPDYTDIATDLFAYATLGGSTFSKVETDHFDTETIVDNLVQFSVPSAFRGIDKTTTWGKLKTIYPKLSDAGYYNPSSRQYLEKIPLSKDVYINKITFNFQGPLIKNEYNYYDHKYTTEEMTDTQIASVEYDLRFGANISARKKDSLMGKSIDKLRQLYSAEVGNNAQRGIRLTAQNLVIDLNFSNSSQTVKVSFK
jgi:hypothetical protein